MENQINKLKQHFKNVEISNYEYYNIISFKIKNGWIVNFLSDDEKTHSGYSFILEGIKKFEGTLEQLVDFSIKNYNPIIK